jgi:hypothetical protein
MIVLAVKASTSCAAAEVKGLSFINNSGDMNSPYQSIYPSHYQRPYTICEN